MVYLILQMGRELSLVIKWGGGKLWFFCAVGSKRSVRLQRRQVFFFFFFFCLCPQHLHNDMLSLLCYLFSVLFYHSVIGCRLYSLAYIFFHS